MTSSMRVHEVWSAGGVVYRWRGTANLQIVLVSRPRERLWALPKGKPEDDETIEQTALREVSEETGLDVVMAGTGALGSVRYSYHLRDENVRIDKTVHHYLMQPRGGDFSQHDNEYDLVEWVDALAACKRMTFPNERAIVEQAIEMLAGTGPV
jgi:8-oxo-dGTP pyrophosphatase MutT (NUDIX family)